MGYDEDLSELSTHFDGFEQELWIGRPQCWPLFWNIKLRGVHQCTWLTRSHRNCQSMIWRWGWWVVSGLKGQAAVGCDGLQKKGCYSKPGLAPYGSTCSKELIIRSISLRVGARELRVFDASVKSERVAATSRTISRHRFCRVSAFMSTNEILKIMRCKLNSLAHFNHILRLKSAR